jgi:nucleoside-diphosphate-sugar epimerase
LARERGLPPEEGQLTVRGHGVRSTWDFTPLACGAGLEATATGAALARSQLDRIVNVIIGEEHLALGWRAKTPPRRGIEDTYAWFREHWEGVRSPPGFGTCAAWRPR